MEILIMVIRKKRRGFAFIARPRSLYKVTLDKQV